jgi:hypothetical protein
VIARSLGRSDHVPALESERRIGRRTIRAGDIVTISGHGHARVRHDGHQVAGFRVLGFRGEEVQVYGAITKLRAEGVRTFPIDRIGRRPRLTE